MAYTIYEPKNQKFTNSVHEEARRAFYPSLFGVPSHLMRFESTSGTRRDFEEATDYLVTVWDESACKEAEYTVQSRFRHPEHRKRQDATIGLLNTASGKRGELYKMHKLWGFAYGYGVERGPLLQVIFFSVPKFNEALAIGRIDMGDFPVNYNWKGQAFACVPFQVFRDIDAMIAEWSKEEGFKDYRDRDPGLSLHPKEHGRLRL